MSFGLEPLDYFAFLDEAHEEYRRDPLSIRKAVACCVFANHLPEHLVAKYGPTDPAKLHGCTSVEAYRLYLEAAEPVLVVIRDLCDYAKHGPTLRRRSVTVLKTEQATAMQLDTASFMMGVPNHHPAEKIVVTLKDSSEGWVEGYLWKATEFWRSEFATMSL